MSKQPLLLWEDKGDCWMQLRRAVQPVQGLPVQSF